MEKKNYRLNKELKRSVFREYYFSMILFGIVLGALIPIFSREILNTQAALQQTFFFLCIGLGMLLGLFNYLIFKVFIQKELNRLLDAMKDVSNLTVGDCDKNRYMLNISSADLIGQVQEEFNVITEKILDQLEETQEINDFQKKLATNMEIEHVSIEILKQIQTLIGGGKFAIFGKDVHEFKLFATLDIDSSYSMPNEIHETHTLIKMLMSAKKGIHYSSILEFNTMFNLDALNRCEVSDSVIVVPLSLRSEEINGFIIIFDNFFKEDPSINEKIALFSSQSALYFQNALLHYTLQKIAAFDGLTLVLNRRFGLKRMTEEFNRSLRHNTTLTLLMLDIDLFKRINDAYGHMAGDRVLKKVAQLIERDLRSHDIVCRYGGEEFLIMLVGCDEESSFATTERIRVLIESYVFNFESTEIKATVSIGFSCFSIEKPAGMDEFINQADKAMYYSKQHGRNSVTGIINGKFVQK